MSLRLKNRVAADPCANLQGAARANRDRADDHLAIIKINQPQRSVLADGYVIADVEQVPAALQKVDAAMEVHALAYASAERAQGALLKHRAFEQRPGNDAQSLLHHPDAHVEASPDRRTQRAITANQRLLDGCGQQNRKRSVDY